MWLAELNPPALALMVVALVICGFLLFRTQRHFARTARSNASPLPAARHAEEVQGMPRETARWQVEIHEWTREVSAQLDCKIRVLEQLILDADRAAARLETALRQTRSGSESAGDPSGASACSAASATEAAVPAGTVPEPGTDSEAPSGPRRHEEIYTLADYGYPATEIAQRLGLPQGEIELILSLRRGR